MADDKAEHQKCSVYVICEDGGENTGPSKVGVARTVKYRIDMLRNGNPRDLNLVATFEFKDRRNAVLAERHVHKTLSEKRIGKRDWFNAPPSDLIATITKLLSGDI